MNRLNSLNLDWLKRPIVLGSLAGVIVLALLWWFLWMSPKSNEISTINTSNASLQTQLTTLQAQVQSEIQAAKNLTTYNKYLNLFSAAVPPAPESAQLVVSITALAEQTHVVLQNQEVGPAPALAAGTTTTLSLLPVSFEVKGTYAQCLNFVKGMYTLPRLITISSFAPTPQNAQNSIPVLNSPKQPFAFQLTGNAYYSPTVSGEAPSTPTTTTAG